MFDLMQQLEDAARRDVERLEADVARLTQERDALAVALASTREALEKIRALDQQWGDRWRDRMYQDTWTWTETVKIINAILAADQPAAAGAELLKAADAMSEAVLDVAHAVKQGPIGSVSEWRYLTRDAAAIAEARVDAYRRARAGRGVGEGPGREG